MERSGGEGVGEGDDRGPEGNIARLVARPGGTSDGEFAVEVAGQVGAVVDRVDELPQGNHGVSSFARHRGQVAVSEDAKKRWSGSQRGLCGIDRGSVLSGAGAPGRVPIVVLLNVEGGRLCAAFQELSLGRRRVSASPATVSRMGRRRGGRRRNPAETDNRMRIRPRAVLLRRVQARWWCQHAAQGRQRAVRENRLAGLRQTAREEDSC